MDQNNNLISVDSKCAEPERHISSPKTELNINCEICKKPFLKESLENHMNSSHMLPKIGTNQG